jgi:hypothetical protein
MKVLCGALAAALIVGFASSAFARTCIDMTGLPPLASASAEQKPTRVLIEALLRDAETLYKEGSHIVAQKPRTNNQADMISAMEAQHVGGESFHIKECNFQEIFSPMTQGAQSKYPEDVAFTLVRIEQFDNFIFNAVNEALSCANTQAQFDLTLSRQILDHGWMEFNGHPEERDWDPDDLAGPDKSEACR